MPTTDLLLLVAAAFAAGTVDAIAGGGGLITLPALLFTGIDPLAALATNKGQSVFGSASALATYWRHQQVDADQAKWTFPLGALGAFLGVMAVSQLDPTTLRPVIVALLMAAAVLLLVPRGAPTTERPAGPRLGRAMVIALLVGGYDGFFGPGTGTFLIVGFVVFCGVGLPAATADAKVVNFASNLAAATTFAVHGTVAWAVALPMAAGQLVGGIVGAKLAVRGGAKVIRPVVLVVALLLIAKLVADLS